MLPPIFKPASIPSAAPARRVAQSKFGTLYPEPGPARQAAPSKEMFIGGVRFSSDAVIEDQSRLSELVFDAVINDELNLAATFQSMIVVAKVAPNLKSCILLVDRQKVHSNDLEAVVVQVRKKGYNLVEEGAQGYWLSGQLVIALVQGHIDRNGLKALNAIEGDKTKSALLRGFQDIISWAYANNADDIDFVVDLTQPRSQVCFKIGGKYLRPSMWLVPTDTMVQMMGTAWQVGKGGNGAVFQTKEEQQAKVEFDLQPSRTVPNGARVRLRWSGMSNDKGTVVTLRLQRLGESARIRSLESAGYPKSQMDILKRVIHSEGGMTIFSGVVGSGKSTSLAQVLAMMPDDIKMISIEDPVELEIPRMYQKTVTRDLNAMGEDSSFASAVRAIYRSALDVLLLGEIRDSITGLLARQIAESGHSVFTTIHAKGALGVFDRMASPAIGVPRDVLASPGIMRCVVYQALLPVTCPHCRKGVDEYLDAQQVRGDRAVQLRQYFARLKRLYDLDESVFRMRDPRGCEHCRKMDLPELNGYAGRTVVSEMIEPDEQMLEYVLRAENVPLLRYWQSLSDGRYDTEDLVGKTAMECAIFKASRGIIDPFEIEGRFESFETVEARRQAFERSRGTKPQPPIDLALP
jgi:type II secretory ATPase GspE/PulE/Tfp pilus assembly ATPase PilB-like protein